MADYQMYANSGPAKEGDYRANQGDPTKRVQLRRNEKGVLTWENAGDMPAAPAPAPQAGAMSAPKVTYSNPSGPTYKIQPMPDAQPGQQAPQLAPDVVASIGNLATMGTPQESVRDIVARGVTNGAMGQRDPRAVSSTLTPGSVNPGINVTTDGNGYSPITNTNANGGTNMAPTVNQPMPKLPRPTGNLPADIKAVRDYTPTTLTGVPGFKNYYATETQPFDAAYEAAQRNNVINTAEQQYKVGADRVRSMLASRGLMSGGGTGLDTAMMGQLAMEAAGARERGLNQVALDTAQKRADFNLRRAEGMMSAQRDQFGRYVDEQKLPLLLDEQKARVKSVLLQNGVDQYAAERLMEMDANEWPDILKNILKVGMIGGGLYTGNPALITAGAAWR